jgi:ATP-dependent DNA ligase
MRSGRQTAPLKDKARYIAPMRPVMVSTLPADRDKWLLEPKLDGYRAIAVKSGGRADLYSMDGKLYNGGVSPNPRRAAELKPQICGP